MTRRPPVALCVVALAALGFAVGLADFRQLARFPLERYARLTELFHPTSVLWVRAFRTPADLIDLYERPLTALTAVLLLVALGLLASVLGPAFRLVKPPEENVGRGFSAHLDVPLLCRAGAAVLFTAWVLGLLAPLASLFTPEGRPPLGATLAFGGLPVWASLGPTILGPYLHSLLLFLVLWLVWAPGGPVCPRPALSTRERVGWGLLAGAAAVPLVFALHGGRIAVQAAGSAYSLADRDGWLGLARLALLLPTAAAGLCGLVAWAFRPRALHRGSLALPAVLALAGLLLGAVGTERARVVLRRMDVGPYRLSRRLGLPPSNLGRYTYILAQGGAVGFAVTLDGSDDVAGGDPIACNLQTIRAVEGYLRERQYRTQLAFRGFMHLFDCAAIEWLSTRALEVALETMERAPSPPAAQLMLEKLADCPTTPENRRILDTLADPQQFQWSRAVGRRWLGLAYLRFGEPQRAREYLLRADLSPMELRRILGGVSPLAGGTVRGRMRIRGRREANLRLGLVRADNWPGMSGQRRPTEWRRVITSAHTRGDGAFEFRNISEGSYVLVVTGGGIGRIRGLPVVRRHPDVLRLDRFHPEITVPEFNLDFIRPVDVPQNESGTTARGPRPRGGGRGGAGGQGTQGT